MLSPDQIKLMVNMSDPKQLEKLKGAGLPTVDLAKVKELAEKKIEAQITEMTNSIGNAVNTLHAAADKMIQEKMDEIEKLGKAAAKIPNMIPTSLAGAGGQAANMLNSAVDQLKQAKEHGLETGNFVPLMAMLNPTVNLKGLLKATVVLPKLPVIEGPPVPDPSDISIP